MVTIKLKNVAIKNGEKFRNNQNYTMTFFKREGIDELSTVEDIRNLIISNYPHKVKLNDASKIDITSIG